MNNADPSARSKSDDSLLRYDRQIRFPGFGVEGQEKLRDSRILIIGCGALGSVIASTMARAGVGFIRIVDRDFLEMNNLQRQMLYTEADVKGGLPKAVVAAAKLRSINSEIEVEPVVADVAYRNIERLMDRTDLILDGTDNFETRFLINDATVKHKVPWVFGGCLGAEGQSLTILPGETPCLNCLMVEGPPAPGSSPTCDSFGILAPIINVIASIQCSEGLKILSGNREKINRNMTVISLWDNHVRQMNVSQLRELAECPTCKLGKYDWLAGKRGSQTAVLCGRNAVQLSFQERQSLNLEALETRLAGSGKVERNPFLLRFWIDDHLLTVFKDGRTIVSGTEDIPTARKLHSQYVGS